MGRNHRHGGANNDDDGVGKLWQEREIRETVKEAKR